MGIRNKKDSTLFTAFHVLLLLAVAVVLIISLKFDAGLQIAPLYEGGEVTLDSSWTLYEGDLLIDENISLPYKISGSVRGRTFSVSRTLPQSLPNGNTSFSVETNLSTLKILLDGRTIYSFSGDSTPWGKPVLGGGFVHFVRLPEGAAGQEISMVMQSYSSSPFAGSIQAPVLGTRSDQLLYQLRELPSLAFGFLFLFTGIVCVLTSLALKRGKERNSVWHFGWLEIALGLWVSTQSCTRLIIIRNPVLPLNFSYIALFMLPFILVRYVRSSYTVINRLLRPFIVVSDLFLLAYAGGGIAQYLGLFGFSDMLLYGGMGLVLFLIMLFVVLLVDFIRGNRELLSFLLAIGVLFLTVLAEESLLLMSIVLENADILHGGMSLCGVILLTHSARVVAKGRKTDIREKMLLDLAFTDSLTGMSNRTAYEQRIEELAAANGFTAVTGVLMIDVNDLKQINDSLGHAMGDKVLQAAAIKITELVPEESTVYRIGGDEFMVFIPSVTNEQLSLLGSLIESQSPAVDGYRYSMACGMSLYRRERVKPITDVIAEADTAMYSCKARMKLYG